MVSTVLTGRAAADSFFADQIKGFEISTLLTRLDSTKTDSGFVALL
jgi:hypothetical protein